MTWLLAAVGATVAALLELTVTPHLAVGGARPHLVLVLGVIWTVAAGAESGLVWAFVGGLTLDILGERPLGSSAFALLLALGAAGLLARALARVRPLAPILLVFCLSFLNSIVLLVVLGALRAPIPDPDPLRTLLPAVLYDTVLAALIGPLLIVIVDRRAARDRAEW